MFSFQPKMPKCFAMLVLIVTLPCLSGCSAPTSSARISRVTINPLPNPLTAGSEVTLSASTEGTGQYDASLAWKVIQGNATLSPSSGKTVKLTIPLSYNNLSITVQAASIPRPEITATLEILALAANPRVESVSVVPNTTQLLPGKSTPLTATVLGKGSFDTNVTWTLVAGAGTLEPNGTNAKYTASNDPDGESANIRAASLANPTVFKDTAINVIGLPTGTLDTAFGSNGIAETSFTGLGGQATAAALQTDGKLVVVGSMVELGQGELFALARYNTDGSLDSSFDGDGRQTTDFDLPNGNPDAGSRARAVAIAADGKIVVVGDDLGYTVPRIVVSRYNTNGSLDSSFDGDGKAVVYLGGGSEYARGVAIQPGNKILILAQSNDQTPTPPYNGTDVVLSRLNLNGSFDTTFGSNGKAVTHIDIEDSPESIALQADGKIVVAGGVRSILASEPFDATADFFVTRYLSTGQPDPSFGQNGTVRTDVVAGANDYAHDLLIDASGRIVVAGRSSWPWDFSVVRYLNNGSVDTTFGNNGRVVHDLTGAMDAVYTMVSPPNGDLVLAGGGSGLLLLRLNSTGKILSEDSSNAVQFDQVTDAVVVQKRVAMVGIRNRSQTPEFAVVKFLR
jgi:uncharacterized delta-60 repeat protein